jgi:hypothetical protein
MTSRALGAPNALAGVPNTMQVGWPILEPMSGGYTFGFINASQPIGSTIGSGAVLLIDDSAFVSINASSSSTAFATVTNAYNRAISSPSYTFVTSFDQYAKIFSAQCDRVSNFIFGQLEQIDRSDDDQNEAIVDGIANVIGLVGEPAAYTALLEANILKRDPTILEPLLLGIATARHKDTEAARVQELQRYAGDSNHRVRRAAVRALGRMGTETAKNALKEIRDRNQGAEIGRLAAALLR